MGRVKGDFGKRGVLFTFMVFLFSLSFLSLFLLIQTQSSQTDESAISDITLLRFHHLLSDISSTYLDVLGIDSIVYNANASEQVFTVSGNMILQSHTSPIDSFLSEYESGDIYARTGILVSHDSPSTNFVIEPYAQYVTVDSNIFRIGGGSSIETIAAIEVNATVDELITGETDTFVNDAGAVSLIFRVIDNTSTTYTSTHTLSPTQNNEQVQYDLGSGATLVMTFEDGAYGDGTFSLVDTTASDVTITGFTITRNNSHTPAFAFMPNESISFSALSYNFSGGVALIRG